MLQSDEVNDRSRFGLSMICLQFQDAWALMSYFFESHFNTFRVLRLEWSPADSEVSGRTNYAFMHLLLRRFSPWPSFERVKGRSVCSNCKHTCVMVLFFLPVVLETIGLCGQTAREVLPNTFDLYNVEKICWRNNANGRKKKIAKRNVFNQTAKKMHFWDRMLFLRTRVA